MRSRMMRRMMMNIADDDYTCEGEATLLLDHASHQDRSV